MILVRGIPGSGKSTAAKTFKQVLDAISTREVEIFSTDDFWYQENSSVYNWDASKLGKAHSWNQSRTARAIYDGKHVIIDNTNIDQFAMQPYFDMAVKNDLDVMIHVVETPVEVCIERQKERPEDRRVPEDAIRAMHERLAKSLNVTVSSELSKAKIRSQIRSQLS